MTIIMSVSTIQNHDTDEALKLLSFFFHQCSLYELQRIPTWHMFSPSLSPSHRTKYVIDFWKMMLLSPGFFFPSLLFLLHTSLFHSFLFLNLSPSFFKFHFSISLFAIGRFQRLFFILMLALTILNYCSQS